MTREWVWLDRAVILAIHDMQLAEYGGGAGVRDAGLLDSALGKPLQLQAYGDPPPDAAALAASYGYGISRNHPFIDGNGRTGRLLLNLMLMQAGYPPIDVKFSDRRKYYACFDSYFRDNDPSPMVNMVGEYVKERLSHYLSLLEK